MDEPLTTYYDIFLACQVLKRCKLKELVEEKGIQLMIRGEKSQGLQKVVKDNISVYRSTK